MVRRVRAVIAATAILGTLAGVPVSAHHSFAAAFDADKPVTVQGVITQVKLANPHSWIWLDVKDAGGTVQQWGFEAQTPTALIRSGVKPDVFKVGSTVTIRGCHARDVTKNEGAAREIILADGRSYIIGPKGNEPDANR
jgi:DNA/RNA endonuclease YhcR with UshA esterase domain